ncbi:amidase [Jidongwangia harbinensis]|uniref:amidase n=1 Tax=Jidongwangia harbinensis TaxID=2878561 RepID=UPI001CD9F39E|nr:amidase [Jidongwangia harbinensis]MCA2211819.1 amidase [Jidongwangia harbinensis]
MTGLTGLSARDLVGVLARGGATARDALDAAGDRMRRVEPDVNAVTTVALDRAREALGRRTPAGPLAGLPITVKDVVDVAGLPTTHGSAPYRDAVARRSDPLVRRLERAGALVVGKTNVPELLAGADTANTLFGRTRNPWDPAVSCGASSGGAAVSVATGTAWCAHGEDTAGSIRIPAAFCGVVGLRPTPGLVPAGDPPAGDPVPGLTVHGPIARDVADAELLLRAMRPAGQAPSGPPAPLRRVAFSTDLGGAVPTDPEIAAICTRAVQRLAGLGYRIEGYAPPVADAHRACLTLLAHRAAVRHGPRVDRHGDRLGPAVRAEVAAGRAVTADEVARAERVRAGFAARIGTMFTGYDVLILPTFGCPPWPVPERPDPFPGADLLPGIAAMWPLTTLATMAGCPALTVPCGRTAAGHPVGLQLVGPPGSDVALLRTGRDVELTRDAMPAGPVDPPVVPC